MISNIAISHNLPFDLSLLSLFQSSPILFQFSLFLSLLSNHNESLALLPPAFFGIFFSFFFFLFSFFLFFLRPLADSTPPPPPPPASCLQSPASCPPYSLVHLPWCHRAIVPSSLQNFSHFSSSSYLFFLPKLSISFPLYFPSTFPCTFPSTFPILSLYFPLYFPYTFPILFSLLFPFFFFFPAI